MAYAADDRAQAERHGSRRPSLHLSAGNEAAGHPRAGGTRADNQPGDRLPRFAREARAPRARAQAAAAENGHANLRGDESAGGAIYRLANRGESAQAAARAAERSRAARHDRKRDS